MRDRRQPLGPKEVDAEKDAFDKEGKAFQSKGQTNDRSSIFHEPGPEQADLKLHHSPGDGSNSKEYCKGFGPLARKRQPGAIFTPERKSFREAEQQRQTDSEDRKNNMKHQRGAHLSSCGY